MSGLAVVHHYGDRIELEKIMETIRHRGPYLYGKYENETVMMGQNYLKGDAPIDPKAAKDLNLPVEDSTRQRLRICYDGQIGNWKHLAETALVSDGPFREERLLLELYRRYGRQMFEHLEDAIFAFVICNGQRFLAARDLLGIKTLFYGKRNGTTYLASELKALLTVTDDVYEFPPGCFMDETGRLQRFAELPENPPRQVRDSPEAAAEKVQEIIRSSVASRIDFRANMGSLLSGGIDSSVIACLASEMYREHTGSDVSLKTFALGVGESEDVLNARLVAEHIQSEHHELIVDLDQLIDTLPQVIYYLESFDPSLVRSAVSNYLISRYAKSEGVDVLLSGEGGDEVFCGYAYLKRFPLEALFARQMECIGFLHNNASLRLDRMNNCHSLRVVAPLISGELLRYVMTLPPEFKQKPEPDQRIEKWIFRKAFEGRLPNRVIWRVKQEFSQGSGSAGVLPDYFDQQISDAVFSEAKENFSHVRSKEELYYFRIFVDHFGQGKAAETVGQWISL